MLVFRGRIVTTLIRLYKVETGSGTETSLCNTEPIMSNFTTTNVTSLVGGIRGIARHANSKSNRELWQMVVADADFRMRSETTIGSGLVRAPAVPLQNGWRQCEYIDEGKPVPPWKSERKYRLLLCSRENRPYFNGKKCIAYGKQKYGMGATKSKERRLQLACFKADVYRLFFELMIMTVVVELLESVTCMVLWMGRHERDLRQMTLY